MGSLSQLTQPQFIRVQRDLRKYTKVPDTHADRMPVNVSTHVPLISMNFVNVSLSTSDIMYCLNIIFQYVNEDKKAKRL
jgi:hypothetical protein